MENRVTRKEAGRGARKEALKNAAGSLFAETGYEGTTIEAIAQNAGMAKGAFYLHFESKEEIFRALIEDASERIIERTSDVARSTGSISEKLEKIAEIILSKDIPLIGTNSPIGLPFQDIHLANKGML